MYKQIMIILAFCSSLYNAGMAQDEERNPLGFYPTISFLTGFPAGTFKNDFDRKALAGFTIDGVISPMRKHPFWQPGAQIEVLFTGNKDDYWKGIEVETSSAFAKLNLINRIRPTHDGPVDPFVEFAFGLNISSTVTDYEIVDEATFLEEVLFGQEDEIISVQLKDYTNTAANLGIGVGAFIKKWAVIQVKYNVSPHIGFVTKDDITVVNDEVHYKPTHSNMHTISVSIGFSFM